MIDECMTTEQTGHSLFCAPKQSLLSAHVLFLVFLVLVVSLAGGRILLFLLLGRGWFSGEGHGNAESNGQECG